MGRQKEANRAEASVKGVGALVLVFALTVMVYLLPHILKGKDPQEMIRAVFRMIVVFVFASLAVGIAGLIVWLKVMKGKRKD